jgi:hypothetical protein
MKPDICNKVQLLWLPGHTGIPGNEKADILLRKVSTAYFRNQNLPQGSFPEGRIDLKEQGILGILEVCF